MSVTGNDDTLAGPPVTLTDGAVSESTELVAGRYRIVRWLGGGGMGRVYEALDTELDERVALKVLRSGLSEEAVERFRREVKLTRRIVHTNVARMFDIGEHRGDRFLTMELVHGAPVTRLLGQPIPWPRLQAIAIQICEGLAAAHAAGVVHRDLKPDNVLLETATDRAVITDFGIARGADDASVTQVGSMIGTPRYMAPEQLAGQELDARADLFSLGVMLFELATGARPWSGDNAIAIAVAQATQPARAFASPTAPSSFGALIGQCLALDPQHRPATAKVVRDAIASASADGVWSLGDPGTRSLETSKVPPVAAPAPTPASFAQPDHGTSLAVLPFGCEPADRYLADGVVEDLIDTLSTTGSLRVRPAGSAAGHTEPDPREVGKRLEVDHVIVGSLRRAGGRLRISARLISVADGFQIWTQRAEGDAAEVLQLSEQLGRGVAQAMSTRATVATRPTDPRAVDLYLRARAELRRFWGTHALAAADLLEQAAEHAPTSPPILGAYALAATQAWIMRGQPELIERARAAIERGLATGHGEAFLGAAVFALNRGDLEAGARDLAVALARAPMSAHAHEIAGRVLIELAALGEGRGHLETAAGLDPGRAQIIATDLVRLDALANQWEAADRRLAALLADPDPAVAQLGAASTARLAGWRRDLQGVITAGSSFTPRVGDNAPRMVVFVRDTYARGSMDLDEWARLRDGFLAEDKPRRMQIFGLQLLTEMSAVLGEPERSLEALARSIDLGLIDLTWLDACPVFHGLRGDPRWQAMRAEVAARATRVLAAFRAAGG